MTFAAPRPPVYPTFRRRADSPGGGRGFRVAPAPRANASFREKLADRVSRGHPMLFVGDPRRADDGRESVHAAQIAAGLRPGPSGWQVEDSGGTPIAAVSVSEAAARELAAALRPIPGAYAVLSLPGVRFVVAPAERLADWRYPW